MIDELDPQTDPVMARLHRAMPDHLREMPSATDPAAQALMKEITMSNSTLDRATATTRVDGHQPPTRDDANVISWDRPRRRRFTAVAAVAAIAVTAIGASVAIQGGTSATDRVHAAAMTTGDLDSGVVRTSVSLSDSAPAVGEPLDFSLTATIRFDGQDSTFEPDIDDDVADYVGGAFQSVIVDGRTYSTLLGDDWQDITDVSDATGTTRPSFRLDEVFAELQQLSGFADDGNEVVDGADTTRYRATAQVGDLDDSAVAAFALTPSIGPDYPEGPVDYTVWIDSDGVIARLRAEASDATSTIVTDARFSDLGVPQTIEAPEVRAVFDPSASEFFEVLGAVPEAVLDECIPDVQFMSDLSASAFDELVSCLRAGGADVAADIFVELGPAGLDTAVNAPFETD